MNGASLWLDASATPARVMETAAATARSLNRWVIGHLPFELMDESVLEYYGRGRRPDAAAGAILSGTGLECRRLLPGGTSLSISRVHTFPPGTGQSCRAAARQPRRPSEAYRVAHLLDVIFTSVGVFKYFRVVIGTCSSLPVISTFALSFQVAPSLNVTRRFMLHR